MFVNFNILNQLGSPAINSNTFANRPAAGQTGRLFVSTDTFEIYRDNGTTWDLIGGPGSSTITGTGQATEVAFFTSSQAIASSANLFWDNTNQYLGIGTSVPNAGVNVQDVDALGVLSNITTVAGTSTSSVSVWAKNTTNLAGYAGIFEEITPNSAAGQYPIKISHTLSSGTAAANMATGIHFGLPDNTGTERINQLSVDTVDPIAATYSNRYRFLLRSNGAAVTPFYITGTGLGVFTATPGAALDIHSTGIMAQLNSTSATANSLLAFQRSGSGLWRIGDQYNGGNNFFELHNTVLTNNAIQVLASSNEATFLSSKTYSTGNAIGVAVQHNLTIPNAVNVGLGALGGVNSNLNLSLGGSTTVANTGRQGLEGSTTISFTGAGTLTMTQGTTVRAFSALSSVYAFNGSAVGTITHLAGLRICFPDNVGSAVNITNNYALLINNQTTGTGTVTYTNRWGIYQEGSLDTNYLNGTTLIGTTVNAGYKLDVSGSANATTLYENGVRVTTTSNISGTTNYLAKFTSANVVGNSLIFESSGNINLSGNTAIQLNSIPATTSQQLQFQNTGTNKWQLYLDTASNSFNIFNSTNSTNAVTVDTSGNLGLGVTPSSWQSGVGRTALQVGIASVSINSGNDAFYGANYYDDGTNNRYINSDFSLLYAQQNGNHIWYSAPSGTAGNAITFTQAMTLTNGGNFLIGTTLDSGARLSVKGGIIDFDGDTRYGVSRIYNSSTGDMFGFEQVSAVQTGSNAATRLFTSATGSADLVLGKYTNATSFTSFLTLSNAGNALFAGSIKTAAPTTGTAAEWKLGSRVAAAVALDATQYIELDVGGTLYKLAIVT